MQPTNIVIPVFHGHAEARRCIESVVHAKNTATWHLVLIVDASSSSELSVYRDQQTSGGTIELFRNTDRLNFSESCNLAISSHPTRDIVLLDRHADVADGWLDHLLAAATAKPMVASVSPFSNNGLTTSYPKVGKPNSLPQGVTTASIAKLFSTINREKIVEIPASSGCCMLMMRAAIDAVGLLDHEKFGCLFAAHKDWSLRASAVGFSHLLCADTFVSSTETNVHNVEENSDPTNSGTAFVEQHPHYRDLYNAFLLKDPARPMRRAVDWHRLRTSSKPRVLMVTHDMAGGVERHVQDLARLMSDRFEVLVLRPAGTVSLRLEWIGGHKAAGEEWCAWFSIANQWSELLTCLRSLSIARIHFHHIHGLPANIRMLGNMAGVPYDITLHDHWPITPNYHLPAGGVIADANLTHEWRQAMRAFLQGAARVFVPSLYLRSQIIAVHPDQALILWPHPALTSGRLSPTIKVALLGRMSTGKGLDVVVDCAQYVKTNGLPIHFRIVGPITGTIPVFPELPVDLTGSYIDDDLASLIAIERPDVLFFPAQVPESFSYTLGTAIDCGLPIVASRLGAFTERLEKRHSAKLLPWDASPQEWCKALVAAAAIPPGPDHENQNDLHRQNANAGFDNYIAAISVGNSNLGIDNEAPRTSAYYPTKQLGTANAYSMSELFRFGVDCRQSEAQEELKRRSRDADSELATLDARRLALEGELTDATDMLQHEIAMNQELSDQNLQLGGHIRSLDQQIVETQAEFMHVLASTRETLESERDAARAAFLEISTSTSWKISAPLRSIMQVIKQLLQFGRNAANNGKLLPHQVAIASQILRGEGAVALGKRVHEKLVRRTAESAKPLVKFHLEKAIERLVITTSQTPQVAIVIPVYGQHLMTYTCLKSIADTCADESIEIIVIDDCSPEPAKEALTGVTGITIVRNESNLGFLKNCNKAAAMTAAEFVLILNNDIIVTPGWLKALRDVWTEREDVGMVGAKLIYPDGRLQEAGGIVWRDASAWNWGRNQDAAKPAYNYLREVDYTSGACLLLKREFWKQLGGFDERYAPAYYEDTDLAFRVREAGKKVFYQPRAVLVHFEGQSSGTDVTQGIKKHQITNQQVFLARWRNVLAKHRINGLMPQLERDRYSKRRILVIDACMLTPDQDAGSLRMIEILGLMAKMGCKVTFLADNLEYREPYVSQIQALGVEVIYHPVESSVTRFLERHASEYEVIILSRASVAVKHIDTVKTAAPRARIIFDTVDLHFLRQQRAADLANDALQRAAAARMKVQELDIMAKSDITLVVSPVEEKLLAEIAPSVHVDIVSVIHVNMPGPKKFDERSGAVFIGGFRHPPNLDAITWYVENVLPILRAKSAITNTKIVTTVIGSNAPPSLQKYAADDFVIAGFVPDVTPYYNDARLSISPLRYGAGVKGKVNIAMQYGVPVIATSPSTEGMYLRDDVDVLRADSAEDFANAIIRANTDESLWNLLHTNGLANIDRHFSRETARRALAGLLELEA